MGYFEQLQELLKLEKGADLEAYQRQTASAPAAKRREAGLTWYPVAIRGTEIGRGDYLSIEVERTTHQDLPHQLRFGASAALFSNHNATTDRIEGIISFQSGNRLKINLRIDELPDWASDGKLGIDLLFDDNSYDEMQSALKQANERIEKNKDARLPKILIGKEPPVFHPQQHQIQFPKLNASQGLAVNRILEAQDLSIVHGPPGTGKTTTLVEAVKAMYERDGKQILVVAPSNTAVDLLSERLSESGLNVVRVGNPSRVSERLMSLTLDYKTALHPAHKEIKKLKKQANEFRNMAHKYKRNFGRAEREQRKALFDEAYRIMKEVGNTEQYIVDDLLNNAAVITATLVGANHYTVRNKSYHTVVIDEAGQALEPACWIPILKAEKLVLAGDHLQLPPTIKSETAAKSGLNNTLLEKCIALYPEAVSLLKVQYRMHDHIMRYSSNHFYNSDLVAHESVAGHLLFESDSPLLFLDTAGCGFEEQSEGSSTTNPEEAAFLFRQLRAFTAQLASHYSIADFPSIAVISPYRQQVLLMKDLLHESSDLMAYGDRISVNTIDSFQGQERDIVFISMTRSNTDNKIGFLTDIRRMNVAMTRARKKLLVIGDSATLSVLPFYAGFIEYAEKMGAYHSAWEFMDA